MTTIIEAQHPGLCGQCDQRFDAGTRLVRNAPDTGWVHERCPEGKFDFNPADVCADCFTVRAVNGACACVGGES
jgi:hypothetical protein